MIRFQKHKKKKNTLAGLILSLCLFAAVILIFFFGIGRLNVGTKERQREILSSAINRIVTYCYAMEGNYPENLDYMKENYGLTYDETSFFVDYTVQGSNIYPDITIIEL